MKIKIENNEFTFKKWIGNTEKDEVQSGDIAMDGWISPNEFGRLLVRKPNGNPNLFSGWKIIESNKIN